MKSIYIIPSFLISAIFLMLGSASCMSKIKNHNEEDNDEVVHHNMIIREYLIGVETTLDTINTYLAFDNGMRGELFIDFNMIDKLFNPKEFEGTNAPYDRQVLIDGKPTGHTNIRSMIPLNLRNDFSDFKVAGRYFDGYISPYYATDHRVWEINIEKRFIAIHENDTVPPNSVIFPLRFESNALFITMPIKVIKGNDTLQLNQEYVLDYGNFASFNFTDINSKGGKFILNNTHLCRQYETGQSYQLMADKIEMPFGLSPILSEDDELILSLRPSSEVGKTIDTKPWLGSGILRHYNAMLDLKNRRLILWNYDYRKYGKDNHISNSFNGNMGFILEGSKVVILYKDMNAIRFGLQLKDKVLKINNVDLAKLSREALDSLMILMPVGKEIQLDILRDKKPMTIKYTTDMNPIYK